MNNGVLQFSLGLATGGFLNPLNATASKLAGFIGGFISLGAISAGVMSAIERGAALQHLSKRTDTSVGSLYMLKRGFEAVGLEADAVGPILFKMQKSLGGVNEYGVDTRSVFHRMGLSIDELKKLNAPQQLQAIASALAKLNSISAASAAGGIFGREGAAQMVQLSRSNSEFGEALAKGQRYAALWEKLAPLADKFERSMKFIAMEMDVIVTEAATQLLPSIQAVADAVSKINFTKIAQNLGETILTITEIFKEGKFGDVLAQAFIAGVEKASNFIGGVFGSSSYWKGIWDVMSGEFLVAIGTMMSVAEVFTATIAATLDKVIHPKTDWSVLYQQNYDFLDKSLGKFSGANLTYAGGQSVIKGVKEQAGAVADAYKNSGGPEQDKFMAMIGGIRGRAKKLAGTVGESVDTKKLGDALSPSTSHYKPEVTAFEKMGFVMGGANPLLDLNRRTASGVEKTVNLLTGIRSLLGGDNAGSGPVNAI